ncbi:Protein of unknown function [Gryllus bimaculatus]|nr:Protein of unknown function [Gryllus bimaculatus]
MTGRGAVREKPAAGDGDMDRAYWSFECVMPMLAKFIMSEMYKRIQIDRGKWQEGAIDKVQGIQTCCNWLLTLRARFPLRSRCVLIASASRVSARSRSSNPGNGAALDSHAKFLLARGWAAVREDRQNWEDGETWKESITQIPFRFIVWVVAEFVILAPVASACVAAALIALPVPWVTLMAAGFVAEDFVVVGMLVSSSPAAFHEVSQFLHHCHDS